MSDLIDKLISQWAKQRPDLDASPMGLVGRVLRLSLILQARVDETLKAFDLALWQFDVLATLRRFGSPYRMSPKQLLNEVMLSSGAMTNRIDRLESKGLVRRLPDPCDRRGVLIELTAKGLRLIDRAIEARFDEAREVKALLSAPECKALEAALRKVLTHLETPPSP